MICGPYDFRIHVVMTKNKTFIIYKMTDNCVFVGSGKVEKRISPLPVRKMSECSPGLETGITSTGYSPARTGVDFPSKEKPVKFSKMYLKMKRTCLFIFQPS